MDLRLDADRGAPSRAPVYLVCAHARHDACCALLGRPLAAALAVERPEATWECTHVGGDRFAGNLVVLPHGLYYGQVAPERGLDIATRYEQGHLELPLLRGRSVFSAPVQAAQQFVREDAGETGIDSFPPLSVREVEDQLWEVALAGALIRVRAVNRRSDTPLTCSAPAPGLFRYFVRA